MFKGFFGCALGWAGLVAAALLGDVTILVVCVGVGLALAAGSCWIAERKERAARKVPYPSYRY